jgi:hypothetical protein
MKWVPWFRNRLSLTSVFVSNLVKTLTLAGASAPFSQR